MVICMILCIMPLSVNAEGEDDFDIDVDFGIDGIYRLNGNIPIKVRIKSLEDDFEGKLRVQYHFDHNSDVALDKEISLTKGEDITLDYVMNNIRDYMHMFKIKLLKDNKTIVDKKISFQIDKQIHSSKQIIGIMSDRSDAINYINPVVEHIKIDLNSDNFPVREDILSMINLIIINHYDINKLNDNQFQALLSWTRMGGKLVLGTGDYYDKTVGRLEQVIEIKKGNNTAELSFGQGNIVVFPMDLGMKAESNDQISNHINTLMSSSNTDNRRSADTSFLRGIPEIKVPQFNVIVVVVILYILINPITYLILKKYKKRYYMWFVLPTLSIICVLLMFVFGLNARIKSPVSQTVNIAYLNKNSVNIESYANIMNYNYKTMNIKSIDNNIEKIVLDYNYYNDGDTYRDYPVKYIVYGQNQNNIIAKDINYYENVYVKLNNKDVDIKNDIDIDIVIGSDIKGNIKNNSKYDLKDCIIMCNRQIYYLGNMKSGEVKDMGEIKSEEDIFTIYDYYQNENSQTEDFNKSQYFSQQRRIYSFIGKKHKVKKESTVFIGYLEESNFSKGLKIDNNKLLNYEKTIICKVLDPNYTTGANIIIDYGNIKPNVQGEVMKVNDTVYRYLDSEILITYDIPKNIDINSIRINLERKYDELKFKLTSKSGDSLVLTRDETLNKESIKEFINDNNQLVIKVNSDIKKGDINIPSIKVEGVVK